MHVTIDNLIDICTELTGDPVTHVAVTKIALIKISQPMARRNTRFAVRK
jgi:hypothetical protein